MSRGGAIVNIAGTSPVDDPEYRYKMPLVFGKIEGRGNGIKTVIPNISDVAMSLHRDPGEVNKFFGCELGAQTTFNVETDRAVVNGAHTDTVLQTMMHRYIENFVLCPSCRLPETEYRIKNDTIFHKCAACGAKDMVDMSHKLCTYILAQAKKARKEAKSKDKKKDKDGKKGDGDDKDKKKKSKKKEDGSDEDKDKKKKKKDKDKDKKKSKKEKKSKGEENGAGHLHEAVLGEGKKDAEDDGDNESDDLEGGVDDSGAMDLAVEGTRNFMGDNPDASPKEVAEVVVNQQMASALKSHDKVHIFVRAAISPTDFFKKGEIGKNAPTLLKITQSNPIMERHLIAALENLCVDKPKNFPVMIKQLYDEDALDEDVILEWAGEGRTEYTLESVDEETRAALRAEAEPVVAWLQDEDSSDEDED